jgi:hypothetical protein
MTRSLLALSLTTLFVLVGCDGDDGGYASEDWIEDHDEHDHGGDEGYESKAGGEPGYCGDRYRPNATGAESRSVSYQSAAGRCTGGPQAGAVALGNYIRDNFRSQVNLGIPGDGIQIYACRSVRGGGSPSLHSEGRALDVFIPTRGGGAADNSKGDVIANWLIQNADEIGVQFVIWDRTRWKASGSQPRHRCYTGTHPHNDHLHVELTWAGARMETPFFRNGIDLPADAPTGSVPNSSLGRAWIGDPCDADSDCDFSDDGQRGRCFKETGDAGFCTLSCAGYCPDRTGRAGTFCAPTDALGSVGGRGVCAAKASHVNNYCRAHTGFEQLEVSRFVGRSGVRSANATICAPSFQAPWSDPQVDEPEPEPSVGNGGACYDPALPFGDNAESCAGVASDTWRCACSQRFDTVISQVCRQGRWLTYRLNPRQCERCDGRYTSGCDD